MSPPALFRGEGKRRPWIGPPTGFGAWAGRLREALSAPALGRHAQTRALAQTFINGPEILLMDEPFSALDVQTRILMQDELLQLWSTNLASVVFVTHDLEEAIALADRVFVLTAGPATVKASMISTCRGRGSRPRSAINRGSWRFPK
jgi:ABC-type nitrate/sulfonate/bicarbonate transport system, ATPase component